MRPFLIPEVTEGVYFGEADGSLSWRVAAIENLFNDSGVRFHISEDILKKIWAKYALNISMNLPQAIIGCGLGGYRDSAYVMDISTKLKDEVVAVALAVGIDIREEKAASFDSRTVSPKAAFQHFRIWMQSDIQKWICFRECSSDLESSLEFRRHTMRWRWISSRHLKKKMTAGLIINNPGRK